MCTGECANISDHIKKHLKDKGIKSNMMDVTHKDGGIVGDDHSSIYLPKQNKIIDTQVWQFLNKKSGKPDSEISKRKVIFTPEEYKKLGFTIHETHKD